MHLKKPKKIYNLEWRKYIIYLKCSPFWASDSLIGPAVSVGPS